MAAVIAAEQARREEVKRLMEASASVPPTTGNPMDRALYLLTQYKVMKNIDTYYDDTLEAVLGEAFEQSRLSGNVRLNWGVASELRDFYKSDVKWPEMVKVIDKHLDDESEDFLPSFKNLETEANALQNSMENSMQNSVQSSATPVVKKSVMRNLFDRVRGAPVSEHTL